MQHSKFVVDETPYCVWEWDLQKRNLSFIESIDHAYFENLANVHRDTLENEDKEQFAALNLRVAYSHGLETFFAFLFSALQAPDCVIGWTHKYQNHHLKSLIEKVRNRQKLLSKVVISPVTWENIAHTILSFHLDDAEKEKRIKDNFAIAWQFLANDFSKDSFGKEYNSIKHGLRVKSGGFQLAIGKETTPGVRASSKKMVSLGKSKYGTTYYTIEKFNKYNFRLRHSSQNWQLENFYYGLILLSYSLQNVLAFLKIVNGIKPEDVEFSWPIDDKLFKIPWEKSPEVISMSMDNIINMEHIIPKTKEDILSVYEVDVLPVNGTKPKTSANLAPHSKKKPDRS